MITTLIERILLIVIIAIIGLFLLTPLALGWKLLTVLSGMLS